MSRSIKPKKSLGQNFLVDRGIINRIIDSVAPGRGDMVIEIGPGKGALTRTLVERAGYVVAIEIDTRLAEPLRRQIQRENFTLIEADVLTLDLDKLLADYREEFVKLNGQTGDAPRIRVVANLPYYISTPVIERLIGTGKQIDDLTLMLQKEVVERITSGPGGKQYGYLSVFVQYYAVGAKLFDVPPSAFKPSPKVWSSVVRLTVRERPAIDVDDDERLLALVRAAFAQRRKTLANNLKASQSILRIQGDVGAVFDRAGIEPMRRAETLTLAEFGHLYRALYTE